MSGTAREWLALQSRQMRAAVVLFAAAAFVVVLAGIAWACLPYHGEVSVYPVNPGGQAVDQFAHGERAVTIHGGAGQVIDGERVSGMRWCTGDGDHAEPYQAGAIRPSSNSPDLMVVVEDRLSECAGDESEALPTGEYHVALNHAVYSEQANPDFDKNAVSEAAGDRGGACYFQTGSDPDNFDYVHDEMLMVGEDGGSLTIDDLDMGPSSALGFDNVAGLCLRSDDHFRAPIVPVEILSTDSHPRSNGRGNGMGNGNGP